MVGPGSNADPRTWKERPFLGDPEHLTVDYIRDQLNRNQYNGDVFRALKFMVQEYDVTYESLNIYRANCKADCY